MDDLQKHINQSLKDPAFADMWSESEVTYKLTRQITALRIQRCLAQISTHSHR